MLRMRIVTTFETSVSKSEHIASINRLSELSGKYEYLKPYTMKGVVNGYEIPTLRDSGASIDIVCRKYIKPEMLTGENVWV